MPRLIGEHGCGKHEAGRDGCARCRRCRRGRPQPPGHQPQQRAQPYGPNRYGSRLGRPRKAGKQHIRAREGQHRKQHQLRLPGQFFLSHASSYPVAAPGKSAVPWPSTGREELIFSSSTSQVRAAAPHPAGLIYNHQVSRKDIGMRLFPMNASRARAAFAQIGVIIAAVAVSALIGGCGDNYRPVVTPVTTNGPPAQPSSYAVVVSTTGPAQMAWSRSSITRGIRCWTKPRSVPVRPLLPWTSSALPAIPEQRRHHIQFCHQHLLADQERLFLHAAAHGAARQPDAALLRTLGH